MNLIFLKPRGMERYLEKVIMPTPGLVACWPLDDPPGSTTAREITGRYPGTPQGGVAFGESGPVVNGKVAKCAGFDAGAISCGSVSVNNSFSCSIFCLPSAGSTGKALLAKELTFKLGVYRVSGQPDRVRFLVGTGTTWLSPFQIVAPLSLDNSYTHIVGTYSGSVRSLYSNGVLAATDIPTGNFGNSENLVGVGAYVHITGTFQERYTGKILLAQIYDRALTAEEISFHFKAAQEGVL